MTDAPWIQVGATYDEWRSMPVDWRIHLCLSCYAGWRYDRSKPRVAFKSGWLPESLLDNTSKLTNCSTMTANIVMGCFPERPWTDREYGDLQVFADRLPDNPDSPIDAVERMGVGYRRAAWTPRQWHLVQGWRRLGDNPSGHAFLVHPLSDDALIVVQATAVGLIGPTIDVKNAAALAKSYSAGFYMAVLDPS